MILLYSGATEAVLNLLVAECRSGYYNGRQTVAVLAYNVLELDRNSK